MKTENSPSYVWSIHKNPKCTAIRQVNVAKHALSSKVFSPLFTQAWKLLPGYLLFLLSIYEPQHVKTNIMTVRPAKTQISLGIRPDWSESSLCAHWVAKDPSFLHADSEDSDQTGRMPRLIWVFAGAHSFCWYCHVVAHILDSQSSWMLILSAKFSWTTRATSRENVSSGIFDKVRFKSVCSATDAN